MPKKLPKTTPPKSSIKILLVEDDAFLAGMYVTKLNLEGYHVTLASDGEEGLTVIKKEHPDIVLLDIVLPKKDGFDVLKEIRKDPAMNDIRIIMLTNLGQREDVSKGLKLGADDYLIKAHFMPSEVVEKIKTLVKK
ncbi:response regulator transcription factor [Patescibacteria group bacterium]